MDKQTEQNRVDTGTDSLVKDQLDDGIADVELGLDERGGRFIVEGCVGFFACEGGGFDRFACGGGVVGRESRLEEVLPEEVGRRIENSVEDELEYGDKVYYQRGLVYC